MSKSDLYEKSFKGRYWAFLYYEEGYEDMVSRVIKSGLKIALSPWHDYDLKDEVLPLYSQCKTDSERQAILKDPDNFKKIHGHGLCDFGRRYSIGSVMYLLSGIAANNYVEPVADPDAYHRYLWHGDSPEKALYKESDILYYGGFEKDNLPSCRLTASMELAQIIIDYDFSSYRSLCDFVLRAGRTDLYQLLMSNTNHFRSMLLSEKQKISDDILTKKTKGLYSEQYVLCDDGTKYYVDYDGSFGEIKE